MDITKLCFVLLLLLIITTLKCGTAISVIAEYPQSTRSECFSNHLIHMTVDKSVDGGRVYVGAVNKIIQLEGTNLTQETCTKTGPFEDSFKCNPDKDPTLCQHMAITTLNDNYNKILIIDMGSRTLLACGFIFQGACNKYDMTNVSLPPQNISEGITANTEQEYTYAFIGPSPNSNYSNLLYVGTTISNNGDYGHEIPAISGRNLSDLRPVSFVDTTNTYRDRFPVKYIYGFNSSNFAYFVVVQKYSHMPGQENSRYVTRLARVCIDNYASYTEVTLQCLVKSSDSKTLVDYNLAQDLKLSNVGEDLAASLGIDTDQQVLVGSFSPSQGNTAEPQNRSAICVFSMQDIESKFDENIHLCLNGTIELRNMPYIFDWTNEGNDSNSYCFTARSFKNVSNVNFCEIGLESSGPNEISSQAAIEFRDSLISSINLAITERSTVVFIGTTNGILKKVLLSSANHGVNYEDLVLRSGNAIKSDTSLTINGKHLYVLTRTNVFKVRVEDCNRFTNSFSCLKSNDPYCGWCSLERRCTLRKNCQYTNHNSSRWLASLDTDFKQIVPDRILIHQMSKLKLFVKNLPLGEKYSCVFGETVPLDAVVMPFGLECSTPSLELRPKIPINQDHINVSLSVRSSEINTDFVSRSFAYYDCSVHTHCMECVGSQWACNWCAYENICTNNISICQRTIISGENNPNRLESHGAKNCPRFVQPAQKILLPNGVSKEIVLKVENLPNPQIGQTGFQCKINIERNEQIVSARVEDNKIFCNKTTYSYEAVFGEYNAMVSMVWNGKYHLDTINVTLYKCDILGSHRERLDCSLCVTRNSKYNCVWCSNTCVLSENCMEVSSNECPKPWIDMVTPLSGPIEGGTLVTIEGSNLGLNREDVLDKIHIGGILCDLVEYEVSVKIICKTGPSSTEKIASIVVANNAGETETSVYFHYKRVKLDGLYPIKGPASGGTVLTISGHNLNIGSSVTVFLDNVPCTVRSALSSSTRLTCVTSAITNSYFGDDKMRLTIDNSIQTLVRPFSYYWDPTVEEINPLISFLSGGRMITVHGTNLNIIQKPEMVVYVDSDFTHPINKTECVVINDEKMKCPSPSANGKLLESIKHFGGHVTSDDFYLTLKIGFIMDNVTAVKDLEKHLGENKTQIIYVQDPKYIQFYLNGDTLVIEGENLNLACDESDVHVTIGTELCNVTSLTKTQLLCIPPQYQPQSTDDYGSPTKAGLPLVVVRVGKELRFNLGYLRYAALFAHPSWSGEFVVAVICAVCVVILFFIILCLYRRRYIKAKKEFRRIQIQMDTFKYIFKTPNGDSE